MGEFNVALNTILYLSFFLFPGIIFRKFFFIREYSKESDKGNLFERVVWSMIISCCLCLTTAGLIFYIKESGYFTLTQQINYKGFQTIFTELSQNKTPDEKHLNNQLKDYIAFGSTLLILYLYSAFLGFIFYWIVRSSFIRKLGIFKFLNYWEVLTGGKDVGNKNSRLTYLYTQADILVDEGGRQQLYSGRLENYFISHQDLKLQTLVLSSTKRYKKQVNEVIEKTIPGDRFIIDGSKILNINLTSVYEEKDNIKFYKNLDQGINMAIIVAIILLFSLIFFTDFKYTKTWLRKVVTFICSSITVLMLFKFFSYLITKRFYKLRLEPIYSAFVVLVPFIWIFNYLNWYWVLVIEFGVLIIFSLFSYNPKNSE